MSRSRMILANGKCVATDVQASTDEAEVHYQKVIVVGSLAAAEELGGAPSTILRKLVARISGPADAGDATYGLRVVAGPTTTPDPSIFKYAVPAAREAVIDRLEFHLADTGAVAPGGFLAGAALTNGIKIEVVDSSTGTPLASPVAGLAEFKTNADLVAAGATFAVQLGTLYVVSVPLAPSGSALFLPTGYGVKVTVRDDLTGLDSGRIVIVGRELPEAG